jgi:hypothetical protein
MELGIICWKNSYYVADLRTMQNNSKERAQKAGTFCLRGVSEQDCENSHVCVPFHTILEQ